jgi:hypothetical protein
MHNLFPIRRTGLPDPIRLLLWIRLALALSFFFLMAEADISNAGEESISGVAPEPEASFATEPPAEPVLKKKTFTEKAIDFEKSMAETHDRIERTILDLAIRLDDFFGDVTTENLKNTEYKLRWRNSFKISDDGNVHYGSTVRANAVLSKINKRLRLSIYADREATESTQSLAEDPGNPGFDRTETPSGRIVNTELRYQFIHTPITDFFLGAGVRVTLPMEAFVRGRFSRIYRLSDVFLFRFAETLFVNDFEDAGETTEVSFDQQLDRETLLRLASSGTLSRDIDGMEWGAELSLIRELSPKSAIMLAGGVHGNTNISSEIGNYEIFARYRRNILRSWLFIELEPQQSWPRGEDGGYSSDFSFVFRLEILFQGTAPGKGKKSGT